MGDLLDARAFAFGMVALINPCGFALLPAYLGFFLGLEDDDKDESRLVALNRAQIVGLSLSLGFLLVFGLLGLVFAGLYSSVGEQLPYVTVVIGVGLVILGVAMLRGFQPLLNLPKLNKGTGSRSAASMFLFGISYAIASLSCTIGVFFSVVGTSASGASFGSRFGSFLSYGLGMGLLATVLTLAVAFGKKGIVNRFRQLLPKINMISAGVLLIVGVYVTLYGIWSIQLLRGSVPTGWIDWIILGAEGIQTDVSNWFVADVGLGSFAVARTTVLGWTFFVLNAGLIIAGMLSRQARGTKSATAGPKGTTA